jgi:predicted amidohydrolase
VAAAQVSPRLGDLEANLAMYEAEVREARGRGVDLVVFPELSLTGYFLKDMVSTVAVRLDGPELGKLRDLSRGLALVAGLVEETPDFRFFNSAVYLQDGDIRHVHRKAYLPTYGLFDEGRYFARGDRIRSFDTRLGRMALLVCEDMWHMSSVYIAALDGALTLLCPSTSPLRGITDGAEQDDNARYWRQLTSTYAQSFSLFVVHANRVGFEDGVGFWGGSAIIDPRGADLVRAPYYEAALVSAEIHLERVRQGRVVSPMLRDENLDLTLRELERIRRGRVEADAGAAAEVVPRSASERSRRARASRP